MNLLIEGLTDFKDEKIGQFVKRWKCVIYFENRQYTFNYDILPLNNKKPDINSCLRYLFCKIYCILDIKDLNDFLIKFGYSDGNKTEGIEYYNECKRVENNLKRLFENKYNDILFYYIGNN